MRLRCNKKNLNNEAKIMDNFIERIVIEKAELQIKFNDLTAFLTSKSFNDINVDHQKLLHKQEQSMSSYLINLSDRLHLLQEGKKGE